MPCFHVMPLLFMGLFSCGCSSWLVTWLCVFYCFKVVNYSGQVFLQIKQQITAAVPYLLTGTIFGCAIISSLVFTDKVTRYSTSDFTGNCTFQTETLSLCLWYTAVCQVFQCILPLMLMVTSSALMVIFLCRHSWRMNSTEAGFSTNCSMAHVRVAKMIISLTLSYAIFVISVFFSFILDKPEQYRIFFMCIYLCLSFVVLCSGILIYGNKKLREWCKMYLFCSRSVEEP
ncbi:taste receptor type 2 member 43-like [Protopterus annectens]|uniref:taste receptor type 2 member 43-like n=1 Tax=Protopterus annectens TaxID=7888 RepID=UPI001CFABCE5|nr:taste receptor type 2 member 43-like [Protopterus annectens]